MLTLAENTIWFHWCALHNTSTQGVLESTQNFVVMLDKNCAFQFCVVHQSVFTVLIFGMIIASKR